MSDKRPCGCACKPDPHGTSSACSAYNALAQATCDHKGKWQVYPENICGPKPYEVLDVPHGIRCRRCGAEIPDADITAALL